MFRASLTPAQLTDITFSGSRLPGLSMGSLQPWGRFCQIITSMASGSTRHLVQTVDSHTAPFQRGGSPYLDWMYSPDDAVLFQIDSRCFYRSPFGIRFVHHACPRHSELSAYSRVARSTRGAK
jgi:hypothetical protein